MADPLASPADLVPYWRPLTDPEVIGADSLIKVASILIRRAVPDLDARLAAETLDIELVRYVITEMIKSAVEGPTRPVDAKSVAQTEGPFTLSVTYAQAAARVALTDDLADMLRGTVPVVIGSLQLGPARIPRVTHSLHGLHHRHTGWGWR